MGELSGSQERGSTLAKARNSRMKTLRNMEGYQKSIGNKNEKQLFLVSRQEGKAKEDWGFIFILKDIMYL